MLELCTLQKGHSGSTADAGNGRGIAGAWSGAKGARRPPGNAEPGLMAGLPWNSGPELGCAGGRFGGVRGACRALNGPGSSCAYKGPWNGELREPAGDVAAGERP